MSAADTYETLSETLLVSGDRLSEWEWNWQSRALRDVFGFDPEKASADEKRKNLEELRRRLHRHQFMLHLDADKEFNQTARMMYGLDGDDTARTTDFEAGMGTLESDSTYLSIQKQIEAQEDRIDALLKKL